MSNAKWLTVDQGYINLDLAIKVINDGAVISVVFARGEVEQVPLERWDEILDMIKPKPTPHVFNFHGTLSAAPVQVDERAPEG